MLTCKNIWPILSILTSSLITASVTGAAWATTILDARDGATNTAKIAIKEPTRIRVDGARITDIFGRAIKTAENPAGSLIVRADKAKGEIYLQPVDDLLMGKATSVFVATEAATYTLLLVPQDIPADTIVLRDRATAPSTLTSVGGGASMNFKAPAHFRDVKRLLRAMASDAVPADINITETNTVVPLWQEAKFVLTRKYDSGGRWVGEYYRLMNLTDKPMVLDEREFYDDAGIASIAVDPPELAAGQTAVIMIVREAKP